VNISEIVNTPTSFRNTHTEYVQCDNFGNILRRYQSLQSAQYMISLGEGFVVEVFVEKGKIIAIGEEL
jgi:hypothetical protein